jgi:hypothetical protein
MIIHGLNRKCEIIVLLVAALMIALSCTKANSDFAFKGFHDDTYRKIQGTPEFSGDEEIRWVYVFGKVFGVLDIGIVYLKKELVWVEMRSEIVKIDQASRTVYGTIKDFPPGKYQIVLTDVRNQNREMARKDFIVFEREEDE